MTTPTLTLTVIAAALAVAAFVAVIRRRTITAEQTDSDNRRMLAAMARLERTRQ